jgi:energy-converting hydrogenase Eha subunit G
MDRASEEPRRQEVSQFENLSGQSRTGFAAEFLSFLLHNKKWWLVPIVLVLLLTGILVLIGSTGAAPFIYTLF